MLLRLVCVSIDRLLPEKLSRETKKDGALVSIESTILCIHHAPHRWYALEEKEHGVNQLRVIGGVYNCCFRAGMQFYGTINGIEEKQERYPDIIHSSGSNLGIPLHSVSNIEIAETTKVVENCHICKLRSLKNFIYTVKQIT